jgi:hypothetical protein
MAYDENRWADRLNYHDQSPEDARVVQLAVMSYHLIGNPPEAAWASTIDHPRTVS